MSLSCTENKLFQVVELLFDIKVEGAKCGWPKDETVPLSSIRYVQ